jgi:RNA recognition motif-containing protein
MFEQHPDQLLMGKLKALSLSCLNFVFPFEHGVNHSNLCCVENIWLMIYLFFVICSDARVMWDHKTGRSKGYGFVSFRNQLVLLIK